MCKITMSDAGQLSDIRGMFLVESLPPCLILSILIDAPSLDHNHYRLCKIRPFLIRPTPASSQQISSGRPPSSNTSSSYSSLLLVYISYSYSAQAVGRYQSETNGRIVCGMWRISAGLVRCDRMTHSIPLRTANEVKRPESTNRFFKRPCDQFPPLFM